MSEKPSQPGWEPLGEAEAPGRAWGPRLLMAGIALLVAAVFVAQNGEPAETRFLFFSGEPRLWVVIVVSLLLGALLGQTLPALYRWRKSKAKTGKADKGATGKTKDKPESQH